MSKAIVLYLHVHQPYRVRHYTIFDAGVDHNYFDTNYEDRTNNERILHKVAEKSYIPTNRHLLDLLNRYPEFKLSLSITGTVLEQLEKWSPEALRSFQDLCATGRVEIVAETYHHSLAFFYSRKEFEAQVAMHRDIVQRLFGQTPQVFRNTELSYNNDLAYWADKAGYKGILTEGWDPVLGWRSPNYVYRPTYTDTIRLLMKNYKLSDDVAFRFGNQNWSEWPLTADKFAHWLNETGDATNFNLFMDYETFGEHQWESTGIFDFMDHLPREILKHPDFSFKTPSEVVDAYNARGVYDAHEFVSWADSERDLSAWLGNNMQQEALTKIYSISNQVIAADNKDLTDIWGKLQTSDHFYYMSTKFWSDGDVHKYFSPYNSPYDAYIFYMNVFADFEATLQPSGKTKAGKKSAPKAAGTKTKTSRTKNKQTE